MDDNDIRSRDGEIIDSDDEDVLTELLDAASDSGTIVVFGPDGMTKEGIVHALGHREAHKIIYLISVPRSVPGDASVVN
jgi:hypothetical protein